MSELQPAVDKLFEECRQMCQKLTRQATLEQTMEYERRLMDLCELWMKHNQRTVELLNKAIWKCEHNKKILFQGTN